jgi:hypothetical protein
MTLPSFGSLAYRPCDSARYEQHDVHRFADIAWRRSAAAHVASACTMSTLAIYSLAVIALVEAARLIAWLAYLAFLKWMVKTTGDAKALDRAVAPATAFFGPKGPQRVMGRLSSRTKTEK